MHYCLFAVVPDANVFALLLQQTLPELLLKDKSIEMLPNVQVQLGVMRSRDVC